MTEGKGTKTRAAAGTKRTTKAKAKPVESPEAEAPEAKVTVEAAPPPPPPPPQAIEAKVQALGPDGLFSLEQCVEFVLRAIVQNQEALTIVRKDEPDKVRISVAVAPEDLGKVIGKQGRTINALRTVVKTAAAQTNTQVVVDLEGKPA